MFALLLLVIAALGGLLVFVVFGGVSLEALSGWPIAAIVIGALIVLYLATHYGGGGERRLQPPAGVDRSSRSCGARR